jgi:hypothetical protein
LFFVFRPRELPKVTFQSVTPYFIIHLISVVCFTEDDFIALANDPMSFKLIAPPISTTRDLSATELPRIVGNICTLYDVMVKEFLLTFFQRRSSPVMVRSSDKSPPAAPVPVIKADGEIYEVDIQPHLRWYIVLTGRNVGVVQGECVNLAIS